MNKIMRAALAGGLALPLLGDASPAGASVASSGGLQFAGTAVIPTFPCPAPAPGEYACVGSFTASTAGTVNGLHGDSPWYAALSATTNGQFSYADAIQPGVPCMEGTARGSASLDTAVTGQAFGTYKKGNQVHPVNDVAISYDFEWNRTGATAVLEVANVAVVLDVDGLGVVPVAAGTTARALASFVPHPDSPPPSGCVSGPPTRLDGSIAGNVSGIAVQP